MAGALSVQLQQAQVRLLVSLAVILAVAWVTLRGSLFRGPSQDETGVKYYQEDLGRGVNVASIDGQDVVWELPLGKPTGAVVFAHGCHHAAGDLWPSSEACPSCLGLPEEMRLRRAALQRGLAVIGVSSLDRVGKRCWNELKIDGGAAVARIVNKVVRQERLQRLPLYTMGASSGGQLALTLPRVMKVAGVYAQVRGVSPEVLQLPDGRPYPPAAFVHMPRDAENMAVIKADIKALKDAGRPVAEVQIHPRPITVDYLTERSPLIDVPMAEGIIAVLLQTGVVEEDGTLVESPRPVTERWAPLMQGVVGDLSLVKDESHVGELLNLAWAKHELVSDQAEAVLAWLQSGGEGSVDAAAARVQQEAAARQQQRRQRTRRRLS